MDNLLSTTKTGLKILIVDDEHVACLNLQTMLHEYVDTSVCIVAIAHDTLEAERLIGQHQPDAIFLDIDMPDENAFQFLTRIHPYDFEIVFVTAYDQFAINAFKINAVDYIKKPICIEELANAVHKLEDRITYRDLKDKQIEISAVKDIVHKQQPQRIVLKALNHIEIVDFSCISTLEGQGNYCKICFEKNGLQKEIITSNVIAYYEELLPREYFFRVHKSYLINCKQIEHIVNDDSCSIILKNREKVPVSRRRYADFIRFLTDNKLYSV